jgi:hypothetical protein
MCDEHKLNPVNELERIRALQLLLDIYPPQGKRQHCCMNL